MNLTKGLGWIKIVTSNWKHNEGLLAGEWLKNQAMEQDCAVKNDKYNSGKQWKIFENRWKMKLIESREEYIQQLLQSKLKGHWKENETAYLKEPGRSLRTDNAPHLLYPGREGRKLLQKNNDSTFWH